MGEARRFAKEVLIPGMSAFLFDEYESRLPDEIAFEKRWLEVTRPPSFRMMQSTGLSLEESVRTYVQISRRSAFGNDNRRDSSNLLGLCILMSGVCSLLLRCDEGMKV
jgi:hypothetical protein